MFLPCPIPIPSSPPAWTPVLIPLTLTGMGWTTLAVGGGAFSEKLGIICTLACVVCGVGDSAESFAEVPSHLLALFSATFRKISLADLQV